MVRVWGAGNCVIPLLHTGDGPYLGVSEKGHYKVLYKFTFFT